MVYLIILFLLINSHSIIEIKLTCLIQVATIKNNVISFNGKSIKIIHTNERDGIARNGWFFYYWVIAENSFKDSVCNIYYESFTLKETILYFWNKMISWIRKTNLTKSIFKEYKLVSAASLPL